MILPATTASLPNFLTPSRLLTLSRPFLTLPCPFLWAIKLFLFAGCRSLLGSAAGDAFDLQTGELATMTDGAVIAFAAAILEGDDLLVFALLDHFGRDFR